MRDFAYFKYRYQLLDWFKTCRPNWRVSGWSKAKLVAVYLKERNKS